MDMGADDYITKPFEDVELLTAIETRLKKQQFLQEKFAAARTQSIGTMLQDWQASGLLQLDLDSLDVVHYAKKQSVYREGKHPQFLYYVKSGKVKAFRLNDDGKNTSPTSSARAITLAMYPCWKTMYTMKTPKPSTRRNSCRSPKKCLEQLLNDISVARTFIKRIAMEVKEKEDRLLQLAYDSLRKRVANGLLAIHDKLHWNSNPMRSSSYPAMTLPGS